MKTTTLLHHHIGYSILLATILLLPVFFLPTTSEFFEFNKQTLLIISSLTLVLVWTIGFIVNRQVRITRSPLGLPLLALISVWLLSTFLKTPNKFEAFLEPGQTTTYLTLALFFFASINFIRTPKQLEWVIYSWLISLSTLGLITIAASSGLISNISPIWTPTGNPLTTLVLLLSSIPFLLIIVAKEKDLHLKTALLSAALFLNVIASGLLAYRLFNPSPSNPYKPLLLSQTTSRAIALEALKVSALVGTGPATYLSDFTRFRPISYNLTPHWNLRFVHSSNYYLELLATLGLAGLAAYIFLVLRTYHIFHKALRISDNTIVLAASSTALAMFAIQLFIPTTLPTLATLFILLVITTTAMKLTGSSLVHEANIDFIAATATGDRSPLLPWITLILALALALPSFYLYGRAYAAEVLFQNALQSASKNNGKKTYDALIETIKINPYKDNYRVVYSQTNFLLANAIASNPAPAGLKDTDRETISQLIQQAIREAKNAIALGPHKVANLENLAGIYRQLLNFAQSADQWTIASYRQAIQLDPVNPNLRIALGGVLFAQKNYDDAIRLFQTAVDLKPDLPNAHYNLALAYKEKGEYQRALSSMQAAVSLIDAQSPDYSLVQKEIEELRKKVGETTPQPTQKPTQLTQPEPLPSPKVSPPLKFDESLSPESPATPSSQP